MPVKLDVHLQGYLEQKLLSRLLYFNRLTQKPFQRNINKTQFLNETGICMLNGKWFLSMYRSVLINALKELVIIIRPVKARLKLRKEYHHKKQYAFLQRCIALMNRPITGA